MCAKNNGDETVYACAFSKGYKHIRMLPWYDFSFQKIFICFHKLRKSHCIINFRIILHHIHYTPSNIKWCYKFSFPFQLNSFSFLVCMLFRFRNCWCWRVCIAFLFHSNVVISHSLLKKKHTSSTTKNESHKTFPQVK